MIDLPRDFAEIMQRKLGKDYKLFTEKYRDLPEKGVRFNTLKISKDRFEKLVSLDLDGQTPWEENCYYVNGEGLGKTVQHFAGLYYVQEPSAASAAPKLEVMPGERVLDLCSAPGGKGTQLAQAMQGGGVLFLNEIIFKRCEILRSNVERLGVKNAVITCASPEKLADEFTGYFDKILVDAPCSGEGMFKKEPAALLEWSVENVKACAVRQEKILDCAAEMLAGGGRLVYSTCTFADEEDEEQVEKFLKRHGEFTLNEMKKLLPHEVRGEGHFYAVLQKADGEKADKKVFVPKVDKAAKAAFDEWAKDVLKTEIKNVHRVGDTLYAVPDGMPEINAQILCAGVELGTIRGGRFQPAHALAMSLKNFEAECVEVDEKTALEFMRGLTFGCASGNGWRVVTYLGYPLGWCKVVNGTAKNHLPKGLRI